LPTRRFAAMCVSVSNCLDDDAVDSIETTRANRLPATFQADTRLAQTCASRHRLRRVWYFLKVDLVSEGVSWFEAHGSAPTLHHLRHVLHVS
jgi:hypothetical protein